MLPKPVGSSATVSPPSPHGSLAQAGMLRSSMSAPSVISGSLTSSWTNCAPGCATPHRCCGSGWPLIPAPRFFLCSFWVRARNTWRTWFFTPCDRPWLLVASRSLPVTGSITTSMPSRPTLVSGSRWVVEGRSCKRRQVEPSLIYGQVKKSYRRRKLVRVSQVMRLGTETALKAALQGLGLSGRLNTAFIERVNLTVRHGVAALARRTWATSQQASQLLAHLEWWRAYYHFVRPHESLRVALVQPRERGGKRAAQRYRQRTPAMAAGRTSRRWTAGEVLSCPLPPFSA